MVSTTFDVNGGKGWRVQQLSEAAAASVTDAYDYSCDCTCVASVVAASASAADLVTRCPPHALVCVVQAYSTCY